MDFVTNSQFESILTLRVLLGIGNGYEIRTMSIIPNVIRLPFCSVRESLGSRFSFFVPNVICLPFTCRSRAVFLPMSRQS